MLCSATFQLLLQSDKNIALFARKPTHISAYVYSRHDKYMSRINVFRGRVYRKMKHTFCALYEFPVIVVVSETNGSA